MTLKEFKEIINQLDDGEAGDYEIKLDIEPSPNAEFLVDIGEIYLSKMHSNQIKIEPVVELDTHKEPQRINLQANLIARKTDLRCPKCGRLVGGRDHFCKKCGQPLYTREETHNYLVEQARERIAKEREALRERRANKKNK